jgi:hypothetical protein
MLPIDSESVSPCPIQDPKSWTEDVCEDKVMRKIFGYKEDGVDYIYIYIYIYRTVS